MRTIKELIQELNDAVDRLEAGDLHVSELSALTDVSREVYERMITLRYVAIEKEVKQDAAPEKKESFRLSPNIHPGQTSLIDAIEEVNSLSVEPEVGPTTEALTSEETEKDHEEQVSEETAAEEEVTAEEIAPEEVSEPIEEANESLFSEEKAKESELSDGQESLAEKLSRTPIADLRQAIGLNTKFQLIKVYFEGDASKYDEVIDAINGAPSLENAMETLSSATTAFGDEAHVELEEQFIDLIERRFL